MKSHSCHDDHNPDEQTATDHQGGCHQASNKVDVLLWGSLAAIVVLYSLAVVFEKQLATIEWLSILSLSVYELMNTIWWGIVVGVVMVGVLTKIPREFVMSILGTNSGLRGILRATAAGVLLDLCNHGILMVGAKLYERGASIGQVIAFLVASPWNSFSLTIILIALIGIPWTLAFIALSMLIAVISGLLFDALVSRGVLPANNRQADLPDGFRFWSEARKSLVATQYTPQFFRSMMIDGLKDSRMVIRWILFGVLLAGCVRAFVSPEQFGTYFGPTLAGLGLTLLAATLIEVCSEGSTPLAADLLTHAKAPGNSFAFLMTGVSTDYTEIMVLKETTKSWKTALFLPLLTVPQIIVLAWLMNTAM